jgi:cell shape-determining protein MreC
VVLMSVVLLAVDHRSSRLDGSRSVLAVIVYPIQLMVSLPVEMTEQMFETVISYT